MNPRIGAPANASVRFLALALALLAGGAVQAQQHAHYSGVLRPAQIAPRPVKAQVTAPKATVSLGGKPVPVNRGHR